MIIKICIKTFNDKKFYNDLRSKLQKERLSPYLILNNIRKI